MTDQSACAHLRVKYEPHNFGQGQFRDRWICESCRLEFSPGQVSGTRHALLYIPNSGLFFDGGDFLDGRQERIAWNRTIETFMSHSRAVLAKERILERYPQRYSDGHLIVLKIELRDKE